MYKINYFLFILIIFISLSCGFREEYHDSSLDNPVIIVDPGFNYIMNVTSPAKDEQYQRGDFIIIKWFANPPTDHIALQLFRKDMYQFTIFILDSGVNQFVWRIPDELPPSRHYRIKVINTVNENHFGMSDSFYVLDDNVTGDLID